MSKAIAKTGKNSPEAKPSFWGRISDAAGVIPGVHLAAQQVKNAEDRLLRELKERLEHVDDRPKAERFDPNEGADGNHQTFEAVPSALQSPDGAFAELLSRSQIQTRESAENALILRVVRNLLPDEARILAALSDGSSYPLLSVAVASALGGVGRVVQEHISTVGRAAGIALINRSPVYISHLLALGLLDVGPEDPRLLTKYEIAETEEAATKAIKIAEKEARFKPKIIRRTIRISEFGQRFWAVCNNLNPAVAALEHRSTP